MQESNSLGADWSLEEQNQLFGECEATQDSGPNSQDRDEDSLTKLLQMVKKTHLLVVWKELFTRIKETIDPAFFAVPLDICCTILEDVRRACRGKVIEAWKSISIRSQQEHTRRRQDDKKTKKNPGSKIC